MGRQESDLSVTVDDLTIILDDRIGDERRNDPRYQDKEDDPETLKLSL